MHFYPHVSIGKVWIYRVLFACVYVLVCKVTDFSGSDKASGVKFCMVVHWRPWQGYSHFGELCSPRSPKSDESASHREVKCTVHIVAHRKRHARHAPFVEYRAACGRRSACVDI